MATARGRQGTHPSVSTASMSDTIMMACQFSAMFFSDVAASTGFSYRDALPHNGMAPVRACACACVGIYQRTWQAHAGRQTPRE
jgi:hypothetical protein